MARWGYRFRRNMRRSYALKTGISTRRDSLIARRAVKRFMQKRAKIGLHNYKLRTNPEMITDAAGTMQYRFSTTNPSLTTSINGGAYSNAVNDWTNIITLYDQYKVNAIKIVYTPYHPNDTVALQVFKAMYSIIDYDSVNPPANYNQISEYENMKIKNLYMPWTIYYRIPKSYGGTGPSVGFGWFDIANPQANGCIQLYGTGLDASDTYGQLTVTYYVSCKNRR